MKTALESFQSYLGLFCEDRKPKRRGSANPHASGRHIFSKSKDPDQGSNSGHHQHQKKLSRGKVASSSNSIHHSSMSLVKINTNLSSFDDCNGSAVSTASRRNIMDIIRDFGSRHRSTYNTTVGDNSISPNKTVHGKQLACQAIRNDMQYPFDECTSEYYGVPSSRKSASGSYSSSASSSSSSALSVMRRRKGLEFDRGELLSFDGNVQLLSSDTDTEASEDSITDKRDHDPSGFTVDSIGHVFSHDPLDKMIAIQHKSDMKDKELEANAAAVSQRHQQKENFIVPNKMMSMQQKSDIKHNALEGNAVIVSHWLQKEENCIIPNKAINVRQKSLDINRKEMEGNVVAVSHRVQHEDNLILPNPDRCHTCNGCGDALISEKSQFTVHVHSTSTFEVHKNETVREDVRKDSFGFDFSTSRRTSLSLDSTIPSLSQCLCLETPIFSPNIASASPLFKLETIGHQLDSPVELLDENQYNERSSRSSPLPLSQYQLNMKRSDNDEDDGSDWDIGSFPLLPATKNHRRKFPPPLNYRGIQGQLAGPCGAGYCFRSVRRDGRFVLQEVKPPIHQYFKVSRKDGCLKLQLINPLNESSLDENEKTDHQHDAGLENTARSDDDTTSLEATAEAGKLLITECHSPPSIPKTVVNVMSTDKDLVSDETDETTTSPGFSDVRIPLNGKSSGMKNSWLYTISAF